jgi:geranylgeranyl pyrophosphate synthase/predicted secreted hydrolase
MSASPRYWPDSGPLDHEIHDAPHALADTEEWHVNCHVSDGRGADLSMFAAFFRMALADPAAPGRPRFAHAVVWAVSDPLTGTYHSYSQVDRVVPAYVRRRLIGAAGLDSRIGRALAEVVDRGQIPLPDRLMETTPVAELDGLDLTFDGCDLVRRNGSYELRLVSRRRDVTCDLCLHPRGPAVRHGTDGVIAVGDEEVHHYFLPACDVTGRLELPGGHVVEVVEGRGWFDHRFGVSAGGSGSSRPDRPGHGADGRPDGARPLAWTWTNIALADGGAVSAYEVIEPSTRKTIDRNVIVVDVDGTTRTAAHVELESGTPWRSARTFREYSTSSRLVSDDLGLHLELEACSPDQECVTALASPAFWEGRCTVRGTLGGEPVSGRAFVIQRGVDGVGDIEALLARVGEVVIAAVEEVLPHRPTGEALHNLVGTSSARQLRGIDPDLLGAAIAQPIRSIVDRGGKAWRSYLLLACCDAVGGDSRRFRKMLAVPEIVHAGSLIIDDIEDDSNTRRGGPACHVEFGQALAINAGNAAYFAAPGILMSSEAVRRKPDRVKLELYELYFRAMRGAHAGQAMDLQGVHDLMSSSVTTGDTRQLEERILTCYRFKTGVPAACFAAMGAVLGDGTERQISAIVDYMEAAGVAFQIIDDVLNLTGFEHERKTTGEDIFNGTVTLPLAQALAVLDRQERQALWSMYQAAGHDRSLVPGIIETLDRCGSLRACKAMAHDLMEENWAVLEKELEPSHATVMLRAFSWFVLERHH